MLYLDLQRRLQQYLNCELADVQAGFRKGRGTRDQIANTRWIIEKGRVTEKLCISTLSLLIPFQHSKVKGLF